MPCIFAYPQLSEGLARAGFKAIYNVVLKIFTYFGMLFFMGLRCVHKPRNNFRDLIEVKVEPALDTIAISCHASI